MKQQFNPEIWLVERKKFDPAKWLDHPKTPVKIVRPSEYKSASQLQYEVDVVLNRIEGFRIDLTTDYRDWLKLGFAFSDEFGETGREYFHRVSRFYCGYDPAECDRQFDRCLRSKRSGISIKSFFAAARDAGVDIRV